MKKLLLLVAATLVSVLSANWCFNPDHELLRNGLRYNRISRAPAPGNHTVVTQSLPKEVRPSLLRIQQ